MLVKTKKIIKKVAIFGDGEAKNTDQHYLDAFEIAKQLVQNGFEIVNGGGPGVMLASTLGAKEVGGKVTVVTLDPSIQPENYEGISKENFDMADENILTNSYTERENKLMEIADAYVIMKGGTGTLSEWALAWCEAKLHLGEHEPVILFGNFWQEIMAIIENNMAITKDELGVIGVVEKTEDVARVLKEVQVGNCN